MKLIVAAKKKWLPILEPDPVPNYGTRSGSQFGNQIRPRPRSHSHILRKLFPVSRTEDIGLGPGSGDFCTVYQLTDLFGEARVSSEPGRWAGFHPFHGGTLLRHLFVVAGPFVRFFVQYFSGIFVV